MMEQQQVGTIWLRVEEIEPSPDNPRRVREDDPRFRELVESIRTIGLQQAIVVRPMDAGANGIRYRIVCGERRWRACRAAGLPTIEASVRPLTDEQAFVVSVTENLQRQDATPLEEAAAIAKMEEHGWSVRTIAAQLGMSEAWVRRRVRLLDLVPEAVEAGTTPGHVLEGWPVACWELLAQLSEAAQRAFLGVLGDFGDSVPTLAQVREAVALEARELAQAPWDLGDADLVPEAGACVACPRRSSCQLDLVEMVGGELASAAGDRCLDPICWRGKRDAHTRREMVRVEAETGQAPILVLEWGAEALGPELHRQMRRTSEVRAVRPGSVAGAVPALVGVGVGWRQIWVVDAKSGDGKEVRGRGGAAAGEKREAAPVPLAQRRWQLDKRRFRAAIATVVEVATARLEGDVDGLAEFLPENWELADAARLALVLGTEGNLAEDHARGGWGNPHRLGVVFSSAGERLKAVASADERLLAGTLVKASAPVGIKRLRQAVDQADKWDRVLPEVRAVCAWLRLDWEGAWKGAEKDHPEPKGWKNLRADGTPKPAKEAAKGKGKQKPTGGEVTPEGLIKAAIQDAADTAWHLVDGTLADERVPQLAKIPRAKWADVLNPWADASHLGNGLAFGELRKEWAQAFTAELERLWEEKAKVPAKKGKKGGKGKKAEVEA